jgi:CDP-glucose 4,6-dehydratase
MNAGFWTGKRVLVTGHTGFKGGWLVAWLRHLGAEVAGLALPPSTTPNLFDLAQTAQDIVSVFADIRDLAAVRAAFDRFQPEIVFHMAAQAIVRASYNDPVGTYATNVMGTVHVFEAVRTSGVRVVVNVTSDKCYDNKEWVWGYRETDSLGGKDPYSSSKACAELVTAAYRSSFFNGTSRIGFASARAGNVIGGGDWSEDRLIPDAVRAWSTGQPLAIRRPQAFRPWQHVLEPLAGYLTLAERLWAKPELAGAYNFGPPTHEAASVRDVVLLAKQSYGGGEVIWGEGSEGPHEAGWLALEIARAKHVLGVAPRWSLQAAVQRTLTWYRRQQEGSLARELCAQDIREFEADVTRGTPA